VSPEQALLGWLSSLHAVTSAPQVPRSQDTACCSVSWSRRPRWWNSYWP